MARSEVYEYGVDLFLQFVCLAIGTLPRILDFMTLYLDIVVFAPDALEPLYGLLGFLYIAGKYLTRHLSTYARARYDESLMVCSEIRVVSTRTHVISVYPRTTDELDEIPVSDFIFRQNNEVPTAGVYLALT